MLEDCTTFTLCRNKFRWHFWRKGNRFRWKNVEHVRRCNQTVYAVRIAIAQTPVIANSGRPPRSVASNPVFQDCGEFIRSANGVQWDVTWFRPVTGVVLSLLASRCKAPTQMQWCAWLAGLSCNIQKDRLDTLLSAGEKRQKPNQRHSAFNAPVKGYRRWWSDRNHHSILDKNTLGPAHAVAGTVIH